MHSMSSSVPAWVGSASLAHAPPDRAGGNQMHRWRPQIGEHVPSATVRCAGRWEAGQAAGDVCRATWYRAGPGLASRRPQTASDGPRVVGAPSPAADGRQRGARCGRRARPWADSARWEPRIGTAAAVGSLEDNRHHGSRWAASFQVPCSLPMPVTGPPVWVAEYEPSIVAPSALTTSQGAESPGLNQVTV